MWITGNIEWNRDERIDLEIPILTEPLNCMYIIYAAQKKRVVDRHQSTTIPDKWTHLVDQP